MFTLNIILTSIVSLKELVPIVSILTFMFSISVFFISFFTNSRRLQISETLRLGVFHYIRIKYSTPFEENRGITASFNNINHSPQDIGVSNFHFMNNGKKLKFRVILILKKYS